MKVGDRVRVKDTHPRSEFHGVEFVITTIAEDAAYTPYAVGEGRLPGRGVYVSYLEVIEPLRGAYGTAIIKKVGGRILDVDLSLDESDARAEVEKMNARLAADVGIRWAVVRIEEVVTSA